LLHNGYSEVGLEKISVSECQIGSF
jgi:hypothetical protein